MMSHDTNAFMKSNASAWEGLFNEQKERTKAAEAERDRLQGRVAELERALEKAAVLDVGRPLPRDGSEREYINGVLEGQDRAQQYVKDIAKEALSGDGSRVGVVVRAAQEWREAVRKHVVGARVDVKRRALIEALDQLDGKEPTP